MDKSDLNSTLFRVLTTDAQSRPTPTGSLWSPSTTQSTIAACLRSGSPMDTSLTAPLCPFQAKVSIATPTAVATGSQSSSITTSRRRRDSLVIGTVLTSTLSSPASTCSSTLRTHVSLLSVSFRPMPSASTLTLRSATTSSSTSCLLRSCLSLTLSSVAASRRWLWLPVLSRVAPRLTRQASFLRSCATTGAP